MKTFLFIRLILAWAAALALFGPNRAAYAGPATTTPEVSSQSSVQTTPTTHQKSKKKPAAKAVWVCPMDGCKCDKPGKCPKCGKDLVKEVMPSGNKAPKGTLLSSEEPQSPVGTATDQNFQEQVLGAEEPVVVDFYAVWCAPCREYGPILDKIAGEYRNKVRFVHVDVVNNPEITKKYKVSSIPTSVIFNKGKAIYSWAGLRSQGDVEKILREKLSL